MDTMHTTRNVDWDAPDFGGHVHTDSHGSWLDAEVTR